MIDISGSMKGLTPAYLRFAHTIAHAADRVETFTIGTRLTRISAALSRRAEDAAVAAVGNVVLDWEGGTRLGPALGTFFKVPRYFNYARGAAVLILSDALERGDASELVQAVHRLSRVAWRLSWASPLVAAAHFAPRTAALKRILPFLDDLIDGSSLTALTNFVLRMDEPAPCASQVWTSRLE
jgi:uncharacterized protein